MATAATALDIQTAWELAVEGLAEVRVMTPAEIQAEADAHGGDVVIKSKDAEVVISFVEQALGDAALVDQSHLGRTELTSLRTLSTLLWQRYCDTFDRGERS